MSKAGFAEAVPLSVGIGAFVLFCHGFLSNHRNIKVQQSCDISWNEIWKCFIWLLLLFLIKISIYCVCVPWMLDLIWMPWVFINTFKINQLLCIVNWPSNFELLLPLITIFLQHWTIVIRVGHIPALFIPGLPPLRKRTRILCFPWLP